jgi:hypothetical protein
MAGQQLLRRLDVSRLNDRETVDLDLSGQLPGGESSYGADGSAGVGSNPFAPIIRRELREAAG